MPDKDTVDLVQFLANLATVLGGLVVIIGVPFSLRELRSIGRNDRFEGIKAYYDLLQESAAAREYVYNRLPQRAEQIAELSRDDVMRAEEVVNFLNKIVYLLDHNLIPKDVVFRMTHTMLIRLVHQLRPFVEWREQRLGARWGRRVLVLEERAQAYHDINPLHQNVAVNLERGGDSTLIYQTQWHDGWRRVPQHASRRLRWWLRRY